MYKTLYNYIYFMTSFHVYIHQIAPYHKIAFKRQVFHPSFFYSNIFLFSFFFFFFFLVDKVHVLNLPISLSKWMFN